MRTAAVAAAALFLAAALAPQLAFARPLVALPRPLGASTSPTLYVLGYEAGIDVYSLQGVLEGQIPPPSGTEFADIASDAAGNIYAAAFASNSVYVYAPGQMVPSKQLTMPQAASTLAVAIARDGRVAVVNEARYGNPAVSIFEPGQTSPYLTISCYPDPATLVDAAWDASGTLYLTGNTFNSQPAPVVLVGTGGDCMNTGVQTAYSYYHQVPLEFDKGGYMLVEDTTSTIGRYRNGTLVQEYNVGSPAEFTLNHAQTELWVAQGQTGTVNEYSYPAGKLIRSFKIGPGSANAYGLAITPWAVP